MTSETAVVAYPLEVHVTVSWMDGELRFHLSEDILAGKLVEKICEEHSQDPQSFLLKCQTDSGSVIPIGAATNLSTVVAEFGKNILTRLYIKKEQRAGSFILGANRIQELRKASPGSIRLKGVELKISTSLLDFKAAIDTQKNVASLKRTHIRRYSEPACLATFVHMAINPLVFPQRTSSSSSTPAISSASTQTVATGPSNHSIKAVNIHKTWSYSTEKRVGTILRKKTHFDAKTALRSFDEKVPQIVESYFLSIILPNGNHMTVQVSSNSVLEEVLKIVTKKKNFLLQKNEIAAEKYTLEIPAEGERGSHQLEMDRPLSFYHNPKTLSLIIKEKKYSTMYMKENGKDVMILKFINGKFHVMAATKEKCIERVSDEETTDKSFREVLLLTFRSFMNPEEFLQQIQHRYHCVPPENATEEDLKYFEKARKMIRENVFYLIKEWCKWYYHDFAVNDSLRTHLSQFVSEIITDLAEMDEVIRVQCTELPKLIDHMSVHYESVSGTVRSLNRKSKAMETMIRKVKPSQIAEQMCLWNQHLFKNISPIEFLNQIWGDPEEKEYHSPNLAFFIQRFEKESYWVATEILECHDLSKRITTLKRFIELIKECLDRNNLFSVFSLLAGLNLTPIQRLKKTWAGIGKVHQKLHMDLEKLSDPSKNMQAYRARIANATPPVIPFLPIFLKDMIFFNDGNPNKIEGGLINIEKLRMMTDQIKSMTLMAHIPYKFQEDTALKNYLQNPRVESLKTLMETQEKLEPRQK